MLVVERLQELDRQIRSLYSKRASLLDRGDDGSRSEEDQQCLDEIEREINELEVEEVDLLWERSELAKRWKRIEEIIQGNEALSKVVQECLENMRKN